MSFEDIDLVEVRLNSLERVLNKVKTAAESAFNSFSDRVTNTTEEIGKLTNSIEANNKAAITYQDKADTYLTDRNSKYRLNSKEINYAKSIGLGSGSADSIQQELDDGAFEIDTIVTSTYYNDKYDKIKKKLDEAKKTKTSKGSSSKEKKKAKKDEKKYKKQLKGLKEKKKKETKNNKIAESLKTKVSSYQQWADKAREAEQKALELEEERKQKYVDNFDLTKSSYDEEIRQLEARNDLINEWINLNEANGYLASTKTYDTLITNEREKQNKLLTERDELQKKFNDAVAKNGGNIAENSEEYIKMKTTLDDINKSIAEQDTKIAELKKKVRELNYEYFKMGQEHISEVSDEISFLTDIMAENPLFSGENKEFINEYGIATLGAYAIQMELAKKQAKDYAEQIIETQKAIERNDNTKENIDKLKDLQAAQRQVIKTQYDMRKNIKSLVENGFKEEISSLKDLISEYLKMLDAQKSEYDYSKKITEQQEKITSLRRQIASWGGDNSEEGSAKRQRTSKELKDAEESLRESQEERRISQIKEMLNDLQDEYEKLVNKRLDDVTEVVEGIFNNIEYFQGNIGETLTKIATDTGITLDEQTQKLLTALSSEVKVPIGVVTDISGTLATASNILFQEQENGKQLVSGLRISNFSDMKGGVSDFVGNVTTALTGNGSVKEAIGDMSTNITSALTGSTGSLASTVENGLSNIVNELNSSSPLQSKIGAITAKIQADVKKQEDDAAAAQPVDTLLRTLKGSASTLSDKSTIANARKQYDALTEDQKKMVGAGAYQILKNSEDRIRALENAAKPATTSAPKQQDNSAALKQKQIDNATKAYNDAYAAMQQALQRYNNAKNEAKLEKNKHGKKSKQYKKAEAEANNKKSTYNKKKAAYETALANLKAIRGYASGTRRVQDDDYYWTQEGLGKNELIQRKSDGAMLTRLGKGDMVFSSDMTKRLWELAKNPAPYVNTDGIKTPNISSNVTYGDSNVDITFNVPNVTNAEDFMKTLQKSKKFEQIVQSMTIGRISGKGKLNKYSTRI